VSESSMWASVIQLAIDDANRHYNLPVPPEHMKKKYLAAQKAMRMAEADKRPAAKKRYTKLRTQCKVYIGAVSGRNNEVKQAREYFYCEDFEYVCDLAGIDPGATRKKAEQIIATAQAFDVAEPYPYTYTVKARAGNPEIVKTRCKWRPMSDEHNEILEALL
jgi:hypothetical protein